MSMFSAAQLASMQTMAEGVLADSCTVQSVTETPDGMGGVTVTWSETANVPCELATFNRDTDSAAGAQFNVLTAWVLSYRTTQALATGNRVLHDGHTYEVMRTNDDETERILGRAWMQRIV